MLLFLKTLNSGRLISEDTSIELMIFSFSSSEIVRLEAPVWSMSSFVKIGFVWLSVLIICFLFLVSLKFGNNFFSFEISGLVLMIHPIDLFSFSIISILLNTSLSTLPLLVKFHSATQLIKRIRYPDKMYPSKTLIICLI